MTPAALWRDSSFYWNQIRAVSRIIPPSHAIQSQSKQYSCLWECWVGGSLTLWSDHSPCHALKGCFGAVCKQVFSTLWYLLKRPASGSKLFHFTYSPFLALLFSYAMHYASPIQVTQGKQCNIQITEYILI